MNKTTAFMVTFLVLSACTPIPPSPTIPPASTSTSSTSPLPTTTQTVTPSLVPTITLTDTPWPTAKPTGKCEEWTTYDCSEYLISNNVWGKGMIPVSKYKQCIEVQWLKDTCQFGWSWDWPFANDRVKAYPSILYGFNPWLDFTTTKDMPARIGDITTLQADIDLTLEATGMYNTAFDLWITSSNPPKPETITKEVMVWIQNIGGWDSGKVIDVVTLDGERWLFYIMPLDHPYYAFHLEKPRLKGKVNLGELLKYLVEKKYLNPDEYLADIELGNEIVYGTGSMHVDKFLIEWK